MFFCEEQWQGRVYITTICLCHASQRHYYRLRRAVLHGCWKGHPDCLQVPASYDNAKKIDPALSVHLPLVNRFSHTWRTAVCRQAVYLLRACGTLAFALGSCVLTKSQQHPPQKQTQVCAGGLYCSYLNLLSCSCTLIGRLDKVEIYQSITVVVSMPQPRHLARLSNIQYCLVPSKGTNVEKHDDAYMSVKQVRKAPRSPMPFKVRHALSKVKILQMLCIHS